MSRAKKRSGSTAKGMRLAAFEPAEFLDNEEVIAEYLTVAQSARSLTHWA